MLDPETSRAWRRLRKEVKEDTPIVLRGLASSGKRISRRLYSAAVRWCKSLTRRVKEWNVPLGRRRELAVQLSRLRLRSPIYKV